MGWVSQSVSRSQQNSWLCSSRLWPAASYCRLRNNVLTKISLSAFFRSFWVLFNSSSVFSNSEAVFWSCRMNPPKQQSASYNTELREGRDPQGRQRSPGRAEWDAAQAACLCLGSQFSCLTNLSSLRATKHLPISSSCLQRDLQGRSPNTNLPAVAFPEHLCLMMAAFPWSNAWWLHSEFLQDFGHTRVQELQTTGRRLVVHQQCWHRDRPDSQGEARQEQGSRSGPLPHQRRLWCRSLGQPTACRYSQLSSAEPTALSALTRILRTQTGDCSWAWPQPSSSNSTSCRGLTALESSKAIPEPRSPFEGAMAKLWSSNEKRLNPPTVSHFVNLDTGMPQ